MGLEEDKAVAQALWELEASIDAVMVTTTSAQLALRKLREAIRAAGEPTPAPPPEPPPGPEPPPEPQPPANTAWIWPVAGIPPRITAHFDEPRPNYRSEVKRHEGTDMDCYDDARQRLCDIVSVSSGTVQQIHRWGNTKVGWDAYGNFVVVLNDDGYTCLYAHLNQIQPGLVEHARVTQGQTLGQGGNTGNSTGAHLHFTVTHPSAPPVYVYSQRAVNPEKLLPPV